MQWTPWKIRLAPCRLSLWLAPVEMNECVTRWLKFCRIVNPKEKYRGLEVFKRIDLKWQIFSPGTVSKPSWHIPETLPLNFGPIDGQNFKIAWRSANLSKSIAGILDENRTFSQTPHTTYQNVLFWMPGKVPGQFRSVTLNGQPDESRAPRLLHVRNYKFV